MRAEPILALDNVAKNFGGLRVVDNLSFSVRRGCCTALIGPNGAGKTTVFNLITGVYPIDGGAILLDGVDISRVPSRRRLRRPWDSWRWGIPALPAANKPRQRCPRIERRP